MSHWFYITPEEYAAAAANGIRPRMLERRVREQGWDKETAMTTPPRKQTDRSRWRAVADQNGISYTTFMSRVNRGWSEERAAKTPLESEEERREHAVRAFESVRKIPRFYIDLAARNGISHATLHLRIQRGWGLDRAATEPVLSKQECGRRGSAEVRRRHGDVHALIFQKKQHKTKEVPGRA